MIDRRVDVAVIGAGTAGLAAIREARRVSANVLLIDSGPLGTTCARVGCMPSKLLIAAANAAAAVREAYTFGIECEGLSVDGAEVMRRVRLLRDRFVAAVVRHVDSLPPDMRLTGTARFQDDSTLAVTGPLGDLTVRANRVVIATGSSPVVPPEFAPGRPETNEDVFDWTRLPASVAVFGNGLIGLELGQALSQLGVRVRVFGKDGLVGGLTDETVRDVAREHLGSTMDFVPHHEMTAIRGAANDVTVDYRADGRPFSATFERVLVAVGRRANVGGLGLEATSLTLDEDGVPVFDRATGRCGESDIYIAGDVMDEMPLLHEAEASGEIAGSNAVRDEPVAQDRPVPLSIVFCEPQIAMVGETLGELTARDARFVVGTCDWSDQGRAMVMDEAVGRLNVYVEEETSAVLGAEMFGPRAEHIAHTLALALTTGMSVLELLRMPVYHPTFEEGLKTALVDALEKLHRDEDASPRGVEAVK
ncbi:dihydrolipoyl dehydrogenase [Acuticoccus sp. I52.16.1]|uniref:dihydrolipoyl dehydrogenase n=1 Tax=Acuticoccus sp. I52.16.1 TaxID=2928472 RepID=UPI001FD1A044|nr:dihydrolipoyl dehydrogenase [Acuticoccus sp. I52.16.1]UOM36064.1 dihydrolipoyl dehydrogenase [Acuticoccus sp. I52.16.1]